MPRAALEAARVMGIGVEHVRDSALASASDDEIARHALETDAALVTRDLDFSDVRRYPPADRPGLVVMRVSDAAAASEIAEVLARFLRHPEWLAQLPGRLAIVESRRVRFRPPLDSQS